MYYILKATFGGPLVYTEHCYEEVIEVHDGIAVTEKLSSAQQLQSQAGFTLLASVETADNVMDFLHFTDKVEEEEEEQIAVTIVLPLPKVSPPPPLPKAPQPIQRALSVPWFDPSPPTYLTKRRLSYGEQKKENT